MLQARENGIGNFLGKTAESSPLSADQRDNRKRPAFFRLLHRCGMIATDQPRGGRVGGRQRTDATITVDNLITIEAKRR
ncbi:hypothetical protein AJ87_39810 [Rhizobium yanglingense]|nr:hypothetical protein AJ87_39810 [Rhizobium yanglingense]